LIKVVTERGVVYLMGLVTHDEGDAATAVVSQTSGVMKVVALFQYLNAPLPLAPQASSAVAVPPPASAPVAAPVSPAQTSPLPAD